MHFSNVDLQTVLRPRASDVPTRPQRSPGVGDGGCSAASLQSDALRRREPQARTVRKIAATLRVYPSEIVIQDDT